MEWICDNGIAEIRWKKKFCNWFVAMPLPKQGVKKKKWQCHCRKWEGKKIVVAEIWGGTTKKSATLTIFLQHFHNKSQVIIYYQFKFEFKTEITFLIQQ